MSPSSPRRTPRHIVVLTGAGISAESGLATFRGNGGLWEGQRIENVATPEAFARNPALVQRFYDMRRQALQDPAVQPNAAHQALARLEAEHGGRLLLVTQNVDDLHERGGSRRLLHMHGELLRARCLRCGWSGLWHLDLAGACCPACGRDGALRPDIVWFGEMPLHMNEIEAALVGCDLFVAIGTSGQVYPAAGFVELARGAGAATLEINLEPSATGSRFAERRRGPATDLVPAWVDEILVTAPELGQT